MNLQQWLLRARELDFTYACSLDISTLNPRVDVRSMCAADKCRAYGKNWTCPPHCGTLEECRVQIKSYCNGILVQTTGQTEKTIDTKAYRRTEQAHLARFHQLTREIRAQHPNALCLGSGGCRLCKQCAWPEPCRQPEMACSSMEGYGLFVTQVCRDNGAEYYYGEKTITYTACILF
jgi:predicted metal-binding protein